VSIGVHAVLIGAVAYIGMQISASDSPSTRLPMAELALPAPIEQPANTQIAQLEANPTPSLARTPVASNELDNAAANLGALKFTKPAMDPIALEALRTSNAQIAQPQSASPPTVRFAGVQTQAARTIVYVVDGSGATANSFAYLQSQLLVSIDRLSPTQRFQVVLFRSFDDQTVSYAPMNNDRLARATASNKQRVAAWLDTVNARGRSNPVEGLHAALLLKPDLVLLITRSIHRTEMGWAQGQRAILQELNVLNPQNPTTGKRKTVIKTIQLLDEDPTGIMRAIGTFHGDGTNDYRVVTYDDLISPDEQAMKDDLSQSSIGATNEQRISSASELMGTLTQSGTSFSVFYGYADINQRERAAQGARRIRSLARPLAKADGRAAILDAQATLLLSLTRSESISPSELEQLLMPIINELDSVLYTEPNTDAQRVLTVAMAMGLLGDHEGASTRVAQLIELADDLGLDQSTRAQAALAMVSLGEIDSLPGGYEELSRQLPFATANGSIDAVWGLLLREAITKARFVYNQPDPWQAMVEIRYSARNNESIRNYIDTRITLILNSIGTPEREAPLPGSVLLAAAGTMSHTIDGRERAMDLYEEISTRESEPEQAADALWQIGVLGHAINTNDSRVRSAISLTTLAKRYPENQRASDAIAGAINATPKHAIDLRRDRLGVGVARFPDHPQIDLWRLELAELLTDFAVLDVLDPVTPNTREGVLAGELYEQTVLGMLDRYSDPQMKLGLGIRMRDAAKRFGIHNAQMWTKRAAQSEVALNPQSAVGSIDQLIAEAIKHNQPTAELELMRAQTLKTLGQTRIAFEGLSALTTKIDSTGNRTSTYWQAWSLMLETIVESGSSQEKSDAVRHITRLKLIDSNLGGSPWLQRITRSHELLHSPP